MPKENLAPDEICPCSACPDRTELHCMCDNDPETETADCHNCYYVDDCQTAKYKEAHHDGK